MGFATTGARGESGAEADRDIVESITEQLSADPLDLPPLYEAIDTEALAEVARSDSLGEVRFEYHGHEITVRGPDRVSVSEK